MISMQIHLKAHCCNHWPLLDVTLNDKLLQSGEISDELHLNFPLNGRNQLVLRHYGKRFGEGRIWDTKSKDGIIIEDRKIEVLSISVDGIDFRDKLHTITFNQEPVSGEPLAQQVWDGNFNFNGYILIDMQPTPLNWLINLRLKQARNLGISYFSDHTKLFHYEDDIALINELEKMLEQMP